MGTTLDLISEIRKHAAAGTTGRMWVRFRGRNSHIHFHDGHVSFDGPGLRSYLEFPPVDFVFEPGPGAASAGRTGQAGEQALLEALDALDGNALARIWEPYRDWTVSFLQDPAVHGTTVAVHLGEDPDRLGRLLRLAVIGALGLDPPATGPNEEELERVARARSGDAWDVLDLPAGSSRTEIKRQYRKLARELHPDRWPMLEDGGKRQRLARAFQDVRTSYEHAMARAGEPEAATISRPGVLVPESIVGENVGGEKVGVPPSTGGTGAPRAYDAAEGIPGDSLFRRIFESLTKKAS